MNRLVLTIVALLCCIYTSANKPQTAHPKREFRGAWIQTVNGAYQGKSTEQVKQRLVSLLNKLQEAHINAVIFQVRPEADALYPSRFEPWSRFLTGTQGQAPYPYWDPMQFMIDECHKRGMEFHAWINPYRVKTKLENKLDNKHIFYAHPEWFVTYGNQLFFNPALQESRDHICKIVTDIVTRYDVDAIHMDDYFYPYPVAGETFPDAEMFRLKGKNFAYVGDWRRDNVNKLIEQLHHTIRSIKPWVKFGVSPFGIYRNKKSSPEGSNTRGLQNYDDLYADVLLWIEKGWIDYNIPQLYWQIGHPAADYKELIFWWDEHAGKRPLFIGQSIPNTVTNTDTQNPKFNQLPAKITLQRALPHIGGSCLWYAEALAANQGRFRDALIKNYHQYPALVPVFRFMDDKAPGKVTNIQRVITSDGDMLFWTAPNDKGDPMQKAVRYAVYRFGRFDRINLNRADKLVTVTPETHYKLPKEDRHAYYIYVVTALDRLHNESKYTKRRVRL